MSGLEEGVKPSDKPEWQRVLHAVTKSTFSGAGTAVGGFAGGVACSETGPGAIASGAAGAWGGGQVGGWLGDLAIGTEDWLVDRVTGVFAPRAPAEPQLPLLDPTDLFQMPA